MSIEKAKACLSALGYADHIIELAASTVQSGFEPY